MSFFLKQGCIIATIVTSLLLFLIGGAGSEILKKLLRDGIKDEIVLTEDNEKNWIKELTEVDIIRNFVIYDFQNPQEVIFDGAKPEFKEVGPFPYYEEKTYHDIKYTQNEEIVNFNEQIRVYPAVDLGNDGTEKVNVMKIGPLGVWEQMKKAPIPSTALSVLSSLFQNLNNSMVQQILATSYSQTVLQQQITLIQGKLATLGYDAAQIGALLTDSKFGIASTSGLPFWVQSLVGEVNDQNVLQMKAPGSEFEDIANYFQISYDQMQDLRSMIFDGFDAVVGLQALYTAAVLPLCQQINQATGLSEDCTPQFLSAAQWTQMLPTQGQSLADLDSSVPGNPELKKYYTETFSVNSEDNIFYVSDNADFNVDFKIDWAMDVMAYETTGNEYTVQPNALLNIANIGKIFYLGSVFDATNGNYNESQELMAIQQQFAFESLEHVYVFWNYLKYIAADMGLNATIGGTAETAALGSLASQGVYGGFYALEILLLPGMQAAIIQGIQGATPPTCNQYFDSLGIDAALYNLICANLFETNLTDKPLDIPAILQMLIVCKKENIPVYEQVVQIASQPVVDVICNPQTNGSIGNLLVQAETIINTHYTCSGFDGKCSNFEFAAKQWYNSEITQNPPQILQQAGLASVDSISEWFQEFFPNVVEYKAVSKILGTEEDLTLTYEQLKELLSSGKLFSPNQLANAFIWNKKEELKPQITTTFNIPEANFEQFFKYLRYMVIELAFGGFTTQKTINEAILGYNDEFLENLKKTNPQQGGNPYIDTKVKFGVLGESNSENIVEYPTSMKTGVKDIKEVRQFNTLYGVDYISNKIKQFDGNTNEEVVISTWEKQIPLKGTDGGQSFPFQKKGEDFYVHFPQMFFGTELEQKKEVEHYGLDCFRYEFKPNVFYNEYQNPDNKYQYFDGLNGLLNLTQATQAPVFMSQTHFYGADQKLNDDVTIYNKDGNIQGPNEWDKTYIHLEKWTGTTVSIAMNLQNNFQISPDSLFEIDEIKYLPMFYTLGGMNFTEAKVDDKFGDLKTALTVYWVLLIVGISLGSIVLIMGIVQIVMKKKIEFQENGQQGKIGPSNSSNNVKKNNDNLQTETKLQQKTEENVDQNQVDYQKKPALADEENALQQQ